LEERQGFENFIKNGFIDTFRYFYPDKEWAYSWWSYFGKARQNNSGWRIDYILISKQLLPYLKEAFILNQIEWSDHCPVWISLDK
jgi:exodeoxyribonuclease-3